jgi:hypothetical protein
VSKVRLSRSKKSGASKHYAWLEFASPEVAGIAAGAMDGYMLFTQKLQARQLSKDEVHPQLFKGANRVFKKVRQRRGGCACVRGPGGVVLRRGRVQPSHAVLCDAVR